MRTLLVAAVAVVLAGCGGTSEVDQATKNLARADDKLALSLAYGAMLKDADRPARLATDIDRYTRSARAYAADVGHDQASAQLADDANGIASVCPDCATRIDRVRATL